MEGILGFIAFAVIIGGLFYRFSWVSSKYLGVKQVPRYGLADEIQNQEEIKKILNNQDSTLVNKAIEECKRKHYSLTQENVLNEVYKLKENRQSNEFQQNEALKSQKNSDVQKFKNKEVLLLCSMLFIEFEDDLRQVGIYNNEILYKRISDSDSINSIYHNYNKLFQLYSQGIVSETEFNQKKKIILFKAINFTMN